MTEEEQAAAILAALNTALAGATVSAVAYEYGKVPGASGNVGAEPDRYVLIDLTRRYLADKQASGEAAAIGWRLGTRYVAKTVADVRAMRARVTAALEDKILTTPAGALGPFVFEDADPIRPDESYQVADDTWIS